MDQLKDWLTLIVGGGLVALIKFLWEWRDRSQRSRLSDKVILVLPAVPDNLAIFHPSGELLHGRSEQIKQMRSAVESNTLLFVYGQSGAGKSTLLKLGLCKELWESSRWLPIYVDIWGKDWENGPWNVLAECITLAIAEGLTADERKLLLAQIVSRRDSVAFLELLYAASGRRPLLVFDQIDDYVIQHASMFVDPDTGCFIPANSLAMKNAFWRAIQDLLVKANADGSSVHAVLCIRTDSKASLESFRFCDAAIYAVDPIYAADSRAIIDATIPESAVVKPENGFRQLKDVLIRELGGQGDTILPIRLRVALAGLEEIRTRLTPSAYRQLGGLTGLEAAYLQRQIAGDRNPILNLLLRFVVHQKGVIKTRRDLQRTDLDVSDETLDRLLHSRILLRRIIPEEGERWSLYHDYLSFALVELDRRRRRAELELEEAFARFNASSGWRQRWLNLLSPRQQCSIWYQWLRRQVRFREKQRFVIVSLARLAINVPVVVLLVVGSYFQVAPIEEARELARPFDFDKNLARVELENLWSLSTVRNAVKNEFWNTLVGNNEGIQKLTAHISPILMAICGYSEAQQNLFARRLEKLVGRADLEPSIRANLGEALAALSVNLKDNAPALDAARVLAKDIQQPSLALVTRAELGLALAALSVNLKDNAPTLDFARALAKDIQQPSLDPVTRLDLGRTLAALSANLKDNAPALDAARALAKDIQQPKLAPFIHAILGRALAALSVNLKDNAPALDAAQVLAKDIQQPSLDPVTRAELGLALAALAASLKDNAPALDAARALAKDIQQPTLAVPTRSHLGQALAALNANLKDNAPTLDFARALAKDIQQPV